MADSISIDLKGVKFSVGFPCGYYVPTQTAFSLIDTFRSFTDAGIQINYISQIGCSIVDAARNNVAHDFLNNSEGSNKLIFIDSDMQWTPDDLLRLCCWSTKFPVVAALYSTKVEGDQKLLGDYKRGESGLVEENEYGLVRLNALGLGFTIIDKSVFEQMIPTTETYYDNKGIGPIYNFFYTPVVNGRKIGEDIYFFKRWTEEFGGDVWVDPDIEIGHIGTKVYRSGSPRKAISEFNNTLIAGGLK